MQYPNTGKVTAWWLITVNWSCSFCLGSTRSHCVAYHQHLPRSSETGCRTSTTGAQLRPKRWVHVPHCGTGGNGMGYSHRNKAIAITGHTKLGMCL